MNAAASWVDNDTPSDAITADDFLCTETGFVTGARWRGFSYYGEAYIAGFRLRFWSDVPANPNDASHPGALLHEIVVPYSAVTTYQWADGYYDYSVCFDNPFVQYGQPGAGIVYWFSVEGLMVDDGFFDAWYWNFQDRNLPTWNDDAAFASNYFGYAPWNNWGVDPTGEPGIYDGPLPSDWHSIDMAYQLYGRPVPEPASMIAIGVGALALLRRKRK